MYSAVVRSNRPTARDFINILLNLKRKEKKPNSVYVH